MIALWSWDREVILTKSRLLSLFFLLTICHHLPPSVDGPIQGPSAPALDAEGSLFAFTRWSDKKRPEELSDCASHTFMCTHNPVELAQMQILT